MPLTNDTTETAASAIDWDNAPIHYANHAHHTSTRAELAEFHHQSLLSPPTTTILKALKNNQLNSFPGLTQEILRHLPPSTATAKGHMHKNPKGLRSTRSNVKAQQDARLDLKEMNPQQELCNVQEQNLFCFAALADTVNDTVYTDLHSRFPV